MRTRRIGTRPLDVPPIEETLARAPEVELRLWRVTLHFGEKDLYTQFDQESQRDEFVRAMIATQQSAEDAWVYLDDGGFRTKFLTAYTLTDYPRRR